VPAAALARLAAAARRAQQRAHPQAAASAPRQQPSSSPAAVVTAAPAGGAAHFSVACMKLLSCAACSLKVKAVGATIMTSLLDWRRPLAAARGRGRGQLGALHWGMRSARAHLQPLPGSESGEIARAAPAAEAPRAAGGAQKPCTRHYGVPPGARALQ
jgi:hypothetical protein